MPTAGACRVAPQPCLAETHGQRIDVEQAAGQGLAQIQDQLQRLGGLRRQVLGSKAITSKGTAVIVDAVVTHP